MHRCIIGRPAPLLQGPNGKKLAPGPRGGYTCAPNVRFRSTVRPGDRLVLVGKEVKLHRRQAIFNVQGFVGDTMVFHADVLGVPLQRKEGT